MGDLPSSLSDANPSSVFLGCGGVGLQPVCALVAVRSPLHRTRKNRAASPPQGQSAREQGRITAQQVHDALRRPEPKGKLILSHRACAETRENRNPGTRGEELMLVTN